MNKRDIRCYTKADSHRYWKEKRVNFQEVHSYYQTLKIDTYLSEIIEEGEALSVGINKKIELNPGYIYFCMAGSIAMFMPGNGLIVGNTIEHMPVGLLERYCPLAKFEYSAVTPVELIKIPYAAFDRIFIHNNPQRVQELVTIMAYMTIFTLDLHNERRQLTSYQTIRPMLFRYLYRQQTHKGENEGLALFIIKRTNLSRTHVFRVLADLKAGGYITMVRGKLISIDRPLPEEY